MLNKSLSNTSLHKTIYIDFYKNRVTPPTIPARKQSRSGQSDSDNASAPPPQRPPKPGRPRTTGTTELSSDNRTATVYHRDDASSSTTPVEDDENNKIESNKIKENAEWYEYGCV